jgi:putative heme transporter
VTAGALTFGVLGAFLAVPIAAVVGNVVRILREQPDGLERMGGSKGPEPAGAGPV